MNIRMILTDLDGTLYGADRGASPRNVAALLEAQSRGIMVVPASGRTFRSVSRFAKSIGLTGPVVSCNGARADASPGGPMIFSDTFPEVPARKICNALCESGVYFALYGRETVYRHNLESWSQFQNRGLSLQAHEKNLDDAFHVSGAEAMYSDGIFEAYKFVAFSEDGEKLNALRVRIGKMDAEVTSSWRDNIEILHRGAGKGRALEALCKQYGISVDETMAFGDQLNDLSMLKTAGIAVAMENAAPEVRRVARIIAPHHDESGVGEIIEKYLSGALSL